MAHDLTLILWSRDSHADLERALDSIARCEGIHAVEVLVAAYPAVAPELSARHPTARFIASVSEANHAELRGIALAEARGNWVFFTEPYCTFPGDFIARLRGNLQEDADIIGGPVVVAKGTSLVGWATAIFEFGTFMPPLAPAERIGVTTNNVLFRRSLLEPLADWSESGFWKYKVVDELRKRGKRLAQDPDRPVVHHPPYTFSGFCRRTFHHARTFGAMRARHEPVSMRLLRVLFSPLLPLLLLLRLIGKCATKPALFTRLLVPLPLLLVFQTIWAVGETLGAICGVGESAQKVF